jgi:hypothetical protein
MVKGERSKMGLGVKGAPGIMLNSMSNVATELSLSFDLSTS